MKLKSMIAPIVQEIGWATGFSTQRAKSFRCARILTFHGVGDEEYSVEDFQKQLRYLTRNFSIVKLDRILEPGGADSHENEIVLTFDDGLRNNLIAAYPILRELKIPATFFVCPGLIESGRWLWTHETRARLRFLSLETRAKFLIAWKIPESQCDEGILKWMKSLPAKKRADVERGLREETSEFRPSPEQRRKYDLMNWDELRSLDPALITIGSHTVTHPILSTLEPEELSFEIASSRRLLEEKLARPVEYFCYPNGSFNQSVIEEARKNYRAAVSVEPGLVTSSSDRHCLPRIGVARNISLLAWRLHRPTA